MKVTPEDLESLRNVISPLDTEETRQAYRDGRFPRAEFVKDLNKRYRWDLFYAARGYTQMQTEYQDSHIDTALKKIVPSL